MALSAPSADGTVAITGASSGIGEELARQLAARGYGVTLIARRADRLTALAETLRVTHGVRAEVRACDLGDRPARDELAAELAELPLLGLCNNAGYGSVGRFHELDKAYEMQMVELNVSALHHLTAAVVPPLVERGSGAILNLASLAANQPLPSMATYAATKAFVLSFSEALHAELHGTGVSVTALCPGPVKTEFGERAGFGDLGASMFAMEPEPVAREGIEGMLKGKRVVVPGLAMQAVGVSGRFVPRRLLLPVASRLGMERFGW